jgi:hypothetical protein
MRFDTANKIPRENGYWTSDTCDVRMSSDGSSEKRLIPKIYSSLLISNLMEIRYHEN